MFKFIKENYVNILTVFIYTLLASLVYGIWTYISWQLWYVTMFIVLLIVIAGIVIGYFWIKSEIKGKLNK